MTRLPAYLVLCIAVLVTALAATLTADRVLACDHAAMMQGAASAQTTTHQGHAMAPAGGVAAGLVTRIHPSGHMARPRADDGAASFASLGDNAVARCLDNCHLCCANGAERQAVTPREPDAPRRVLFVVEATIFQSIESLIAPSQGLDRFVEHAGPPAALQPLTLRTFHRLRI